MRGGDQQAVEHTSSSALLYLSHCLYLCTYYDDVYIMIKYNKPEPQLKRGIYSFTSCVVTRSCSKAASGYPLSLLFKSIVLYHLEDWSCPNQYHTS